MARERPVVIPIEVDTTASNAALNRLEARARGLQARGASGAGIPPGAGGTSNESASEVLSGGGASPLVAATALHAANVVAAARRAAAAPRPDLSALDGRSATQLTAVSSAEAALASSVSAAFKPGLSAALIAARIPDAIQGKFTKGINSAMHREFPGIHIAAGEAALGQGATAMLIRRGLGPAAAIEEVRPWIHRRAQVATMLSAAPVGRTKPGSQLHNAIMARHISRNMLRSVARSPDYFMGRRMRVPGPGDYVPLSLKAKAIRRGGTPGSFRAITGASARGLVASTALRGALGAFIGAALLQASGAGSPKRVDRLVAGGLTAYAAGATETVLGTFDSMFGDTLQGGAKAAVEAATLVATFFGDSGAAKGGQQLMRRMVSGWNSDKIAKAKLALDVVAQSRATTIAKAEGIAGRFESVRDMDTLIFKFLRDSGGLAIRKQQAGMVPLPGPKPASNLARTFGIGG